MLVRPMLLHRMALVSVRLFCKKLRNLQEFFGQMGYRPHWQKIARTPMAPALGTPGEVLSVFVFCFVLFFFLIGLTQVR